MDRDNKLLILPIAASIIAIVLVIVSTSQYGPGVGPDSTGYISAARSLLDGNGLILSDGMHYVYWPPLFPALLSFIGLTGIDPLISARFLNAAIFGIIVFTTGLWLLRNTKPLPLTLFGVAAVLLAEPVFRMSTMVMSEPLFILLALVSLYTLQRFIETGKKSTLLLASVFTALSCLTRYTGLMIILTGLILILVQQNRSVKNRLIDGAIFGIIAVLPLVAWIIRNYVVTATLTGLRGPSSVTIFGSIKAALATLSGYFLPRELASEIRVALVGLVFILLAVLMIILLRRKDSRVSLRGREHLMLLLVFTVMYIGFMVISATISNSTPVERRLASPVYMPLVLLLVIVIMNIPPLWRNRPWHPVANAFLATIVCIWLIFPIWQMAIDIRTSIHDGAGGYATRVWHDSELVNYLKENALPGQVVNNGTDVIYYFTETRTRLAPMKYIPNSPSSKLNDLSSISTLLNDGEVFLIWFDAITHRDYLFSPQELQVYFDIELFLQFTDGTVYTVK